MGPLTAQKGASDTHGIGRSASDVAEFARAADGDAIPVHSLIAAFEDEVASKTQLVETLTEQLERAAEEIDRMQRSGADRRRGGGLPNDLIDDHRQLMQDMQRIVQQWEDLQAGFALGRIEIQLTELRDFVGERLVAPNMLPTVHSSESPAVITEPLAGSRSSESSSGPSAVSAWEMLKSQMLDTSADTGTESLEGIAKAQLEPLPPAPAALDDNVTDVATLQAAVTERDAYIASLLRRLRTVEEVTLPHDWSELSAAAPDLTESLQQMSVRLEETLRMAEVELSLERAQVARSQMQIAAQQELISKHLKRLGVSSVEELAGVDTNGGSGANDRRWARFLGGGKKS